MYVQFTLYVQGECCVKNPLSELGCYTEIKKNDFYMFYAAGTLHKCLLD